MGCSDSKESDQMAVGRHSKGQLYKEQAEDAASMLAGTDRLYTRLQLSICCTDLANLDDFGKSDPFVVVKLCVPSESDQAVEICRTEIISNSLNPKFVTIVPVAFKFEETQILHFEVYDMDTDFESADASDVDLSKQELQGRAECALAQIVGGRDQVWENVLTGGLKSGGKNGPSKIIVRAEEATNSNALVELTIGGGFFRDTHGSGSFLRFSRIGETGPPVPCFKTEVIKNKASPWAPIKISIQILANGDPYRPLLIEVFWWKKSGSHILLGSCMSSIVDLTAKATARQELHLDGRAGTLNVSSCSLTPQPSFVDYIAGGMQIGFTVALDYTASNGDPSQPNTLHYHDPSGRTLNEYGRAIHAVGGVLEFFDADRRFPLYGFGGRPTENGPANHCFAVNGNENEPEVVGIAGVLSAYQKSLRIVKLSGPTLFAPCIAQAARAARDAAKGSTHQHYTILLLITDGAICDMETTVDAIIEAAHHPFSIVIVGVGNADYSSMKKFDGDDERLTNRAGQEASRDIVQFVAMRDLVGASPHVIAKEVLAEIPSQVIEYMKMHKIVPGQRPHATPPSTPFTSQQTQQDKGHAAPPPYSII